MRSAKQIDNEVNAWLYCQRNRDDYVEYASADRITVDGTFSIGQLARILEILTKEGTLMGQHLRKLKEIEEFQESMT